MRTKTAVCSLWFVLLLSGATMAETELERKYQSVLDNAHRQGLPAVSALVSRDGQTWMGVAGTGSDGSGNALDPDARFRLASITKLFTATVILQLVDEEKLHLGDTLVQLLTGEVVSQIPHADSITLSMLLDHTSGIRSFSDNDAFWREAYGNGGLDRVWAPKDLIAYGLRKKPYFKPASGDRKYSNSNYILLGMIIEASTGQSLAVAYRERIFGPLGMQGTLLEGFDTGMETVQHSFVKAGRGQRTLAGKRGWQKTDRKGVYNLSATYAHYNSWAWAAGGLSSSTGDLDRFLIALRNGSLLAESSEAILFRDNSAEGNSGMVFGGSGGWDGITSAAYEINGNVRVVVLANGTGFGVDANTLVSELYRTDDNHALSENSADHEVSKK